jgi:hypothetical protein
MGYSQRISAKKIGLLAGPSLFVIIAIMPIEGISFEARIVVATTIDRLRNY